MIDSIVNFSKDHALNIFIILFVTYLMRKFSSIIIRRIIKKSLRPETFKTEHDEKQREDTLIGTIGAGVRVSIWILTALLLLSEIGLDIAPLLAGAGIAGVALGFGAQSIVKDFLAGLFILTENQYRVGDVIQINRDVSGTVERISLRATTLRDIDGMVHVIPNGNIEIATNMTMEFAKVNLDIGVGYDTDIDKLEKIINQVGTKLAVDVDWKDKIKEAPLFVRVTDFGDSAIIIKIIGKTEPKHQWAVTGELRRRLKKAFDKNGIQIPYPQRVIHNPKTKK
jgi:moderate conductance mechanosensitive channel